EEGGDGVARVGVGGAQGWVSPVSVGGVQDGDGVGVALDGAGEDGDGAVSACSGSGFRLAIAAGAGCRPVGARRESGSADVAAVPVREPVLIGLALQGGGAHGAFTWGVLDRFLEEPWLRIDGISGTSAGAMNAAALAYGYWSGGNDGARAALEIFWRRVSQAGQLSPIRRGPLDVILGRWTLDNSPAFVAMDMMSRLF